ncbi:protein transport protein Sec24A [Platysternon megacephalum]|uniref:Protein transport protein Sec24A n=1 Tax=Platysternon megacephalum TaxID=55544 RepID=A0A4D9EIR1_9SAUR|nr:protein transport protein Sec24A [Platysternon megacephalum]
MKNTPLKTSLMVRSLRIEKSLSKDPVDFEVCTEKDLQYTEGALQTEEFSISVSKRTSVTSYNTLYHCCLCDTEHYLNPLHQDVLLEGSCSKEAWPPSEVDSKGGSHAYTVYRALHKGDGKRETLSFHTTLPFTLE